MEALEEFLESLIDNIDQEAGLGRMGGGSVVVNDYMNSFKEKNNRMGSVIAPPMEALNPFPHLS